MSDIFANSGFRREFFWISFSKREITILFRLPISKMKDTFDEIGLFEVSGNDSVFDIQEKINNFKNGLGLRISDGISGDRNANIEDKLKEILKCN